MSDNGHVKNIRTQPDGMHALVDIVADDGSKHCIRVLTKKGMDRLMRTINDARNQHQVSKK